MNKGSSNIVLVYDASCGPQLASDKKTLIWEAQIKLFATGEKNA